jgi:hypothetical protein
MSTTLDNTSPSSPVSSAGMCAACFVERVYGVTLSRYAHTEDHTCGNRMHNPLSAAPRVLRVLRTDPRLTKHERIGVLHDYWSGSDARVNRAIDVWWNLETTAPAA